MALMQLVAYGAQDIYLTGNPEISFFDPNFKGNTNYKKQKHTKSRYIKTNKIEHTTNYKKYTNFASENKETEFQIHLGKTADIFIPKNDDLLSKSYVKINIQGDNNINNFVPNLGEKIIKKFEISINNIKISSYDNDYMKIYNFTNRESNDYILYKNLIKLEDGNLIIPLLFWFCKDFSQSLPLRSLQHHEIKIHLEFEDLENIYNGDKEITLKGSLMCDYICLDSNERRRFAQSIKKKYLIEQVQVNEYDITEEEEQTFNLIFNHPTKQIFWIIKDNDEFVSHLNRVAIQLNGHNRIEKDAIYFNKIQPYQNKQYSMKGLYSYSFSLNPNNLQPSGSINFSRINNSRLKCQFKPSESTNRKIKIYAINYNIMKIVSGMGSLAYFN
jgi:hypothetical protein